MRYEDLSPGPAYMGQCDRALVFVADFPVWNESEDFWGDPVDWSEPILQ